MPLRRLRWMLACLPLLLVTVPEARAQAWVQPEGHAYLKLSYGRSAAGEQFDAGGDVKPYAPGVDGHAFYDRSFYLYAEYGLTDNLTLVGLLPVKRISVVRDEDTFETGAVGSVMLTLRVGMKEFFGVRSDRHTIALNAGVSLPTGYARNASPSVGSGQVDAQATLHYGLSLYPFPGYAQAGVGYRYRSALYALSSRQTCDARDDDCLDDARPKYDDELLFSAEAGVSLGRRALVQALAFGVWSNQPPETDFDPRNPIPTRQRYIKLGGGLTLYPVRDLGLSAQVFLTPTGRNTVRSTDLFLGVEYRLP